MNLHKIIAAACSLFHCVVSAGAHMDRAAPEDCRAFIELAVRDTVCVYVCVCLRNCVHGFRKLAPVAPLAAQVNGSSSASFPSSSWTAWIRQDRADALWLVPLVCIKPACRCQARDHEHLRLCGYRGRRGHGLRGPGGGQDLGHPGSISSQEGGLVALAPANRDAKDRESRCTRAHSAQTNE